MNQNEQLYQFLKDEKFQCSDHPDCQMKAIHFGEQSTFKSRILCLQCILNDQDRNSQNQIYQIREFLINPIKVIEQITAQDGNKSQNLIQIPNMIQQLIIELRQIQVLVQESIKLFEQQLQKFNNEIDQNKNELLGKINFSYFQELFSLVWQMDTHQGTNEYKKLQDYFDWLTQNIRQIMKTSIDENFRNQFQTINTFSNDFNNQKQIIDKSIQNINNNININTIPIDIRDFLEIHHEISKEKQITYQLIYQGSVDGLNSNSYWQKVNNQSQLLTFMTSKNGNKFGGYCPLQLKIDGKHLHDDSLRSFIFQYNKKQIYRQYVKNDTTYCYQECGPIYGTKSGNDIVIGSNFQTGNSGGLGLHFDISQYEIENKSTHIFGDLEPNLVECKVYKITFI